VDWPLIRHVALVAALVLGGGAVVVNLLTPERQVQKGRTTDQRVREGPYIASTKALSAAEELSIVVVPSPLGEPLDVKCFLYRNREMNQVVFTCPDVRQEDISLPELDRPR
jgi:hypothetical protein